jgi:hypothetical protein
MQVLTLAGISPVQVRAYNVSLIIVMRILDSSHFVRCRLPDNPHRNKKNCWCTAQWLWKNPR